MRVNTEIIDTYLASKSLEKMKRHWIFSAIVEGQYLCEEPKDINEQKLKDVYKMIAGKLQNFKPLNECLWLQFYGHTRIPESMSVYLIAGSPNPYDAMVRQDAEGNCCVIFDLVRISSYSDDISILSDIVSRLITHEISHILTNSIYPYPENEASHFDCLKHIVFDEGIAHILSFSEDVLSIDWQSDEMNLRRNGSYQALLNALKKDDKDDNEHLLEKSNSGPFWGKFGAVSGLFALIDAYYNNGKDLSVFRHIFKKGPDCLIDIILSRPEG